MRRAVLAKFSYPPNKAIRQQLLETGSRLLIEASPWDDFWGCGLSADGFHASNQKYPGRNELGKILMEVRDILREREGGKNADGTEPSEAKGEESENK